MSDNTDMQFPELTYNRPSVYRLWQQAQREGGSQGEIEDRYRELLEEFGHRNVETAQW